MPAKSRVFVIGVDGGSWNVINPLLAEGELPNLARLLQESAHGILRSTIPPITCPAWFTFSTGLPPSRLGIYGFWGLRPRSNELVFYSYDMVREAEFWDLLMAEGYSCGIVNEPLLYPRKKHKGYVVPGFITPSEEFTTYPEELLLQLDKIVGGYESDVEGTFVVDDEALFKSCLRVTRKRSRTFEWLIDKYPTDFFLGVFTSTDRICHRFLNRAFFGAGEEKETAWEAIREVYRVVDEGIGTVMQKLEEEDVLIIMSDHGFSATRWNIRINNYLVEKGLLSVKVRGLAETLGLTQRSLGKLLHRMGVMKAAARLVPQHVRELFPQGETIFGEYPIYNLVGRGRVDWKRTRILSFGYTNYVNTLDRPGGMVGEREAQEIKEQVGRELLRLRDPDGNSGLLAVLEPREAYGSPDLVNPPDFILLEKGEWQVNADLTREREVFAVSRRANHSLEGIFILRHPWAKKGPIGRPLAMEDLAPLILGFFGLPAAPEMEGGIRLALFHEHSPCAREISRVMQKALLDREEKERIRRKVKELKRKRVL